MIGLPPSIDSTMASSRAFSWIARAMRKMYFARSLPRIFDQYLVVRASRAAFTASSTSRASASATSASFSSVLGLIVVEVLAAPRRDATGRR